MHGRKKRYYHKTFVVQKSVRMTVVSVILVVVAAIGVLRGCYVYPEWKRRVEQLAFEQIFAQKHLQLSFPNVYDCLVKMMPVIRTAEANNKALSAQRNGVMKPETQAEEAPVTENHIKSVDMSEDGITFRNETGYTPEVEQYLAMPLASKVTYGEPAVLIMHTHTSEAYAESENARTTDSAKNVVRVGAVLAERLKMHGISVIHDTVQNDAPSYNGSYTKAMKNIQNQLEKHPTISVVLDVHRDYAEQTKNGEKIQLKPVTEIEGQAVAQVMLVVGTDGLGLSHPEWKKNLSLAVKLQAQMQQISAAFPRPINLRRERFNQHLTNGSLIVEVGTAGNTVAECERAAQYFADALAEVLEK